MNTFFKHVCAALTVAVVVTGCHHPSAKGVKASSFGWNATNVTVCLQEAFDSGAAKVVIDRQAGDWIVEPVFLRSNLEVVLEDGVVVRALPGAFRGKNDCLFTARGVTNVILRGNNNTVKLSNCQTGQDGANNAIPALRMERDDYTDRKEYCFSEWRHTLNIIDSSNVCVSDLALSRSGGDGIYIGRGSEGINIHRVDCRDHYRQGVSVISARNLVIADSRFAATKGTPPQCGIDFEPNKPRDHLSNCVVENCEFDGNASSGILFHLTQLDETTEPISITIRNCRAHDNTANGLTMTVGANGKHKPVKGEIRIENCQFAGNKARAMVINGVSRDTASVTVKDSFLDARGGMWSGLMVNNNGLFADAANLAFENCRLAVDNEPAVEFSGAAGVGIESIGGTLAVERGGAAAPFDFEALAAQNRPNPEIRKAFGDGAVDYRALRPVAPEAIVKKATPMCRGKFTFLQYLPKEGEYEITFRAETVGDRKLNCPIQMRDMMGTDLGVFCITAAVQKVIVRTAGRNLRRFEIDTRGNTISISSPYPGQGLLANVPLNLFRETCRLYFVVPDGTRKVHVAVTPEEPVTVTMLDASGTAVASMPCQTAAATLAAECGTTTAEVWSIDVKAVEDAKLRLGSSIIPILAMEAMAGLVQE
ncbi:MAG: right-handed parallel beta-helix repeat-containing protein [Kiritimatiellae bacterium]|nr:right-handed parallel beta-helix repeat-containing protein [Kiritimatiellia bacterium]